MITGFADQGTADIFNGVESKQALKTLAKELWPVARRKLTMLNAATSTRDLHAPPSNRFEKLKGDYVGKCSIRVNAQFRVVFVFEGGDASEVEIIDYH